MDAFEILRQDHQKVSGIFQQIEKGAGNQEQLFRQLKQELNLHAQIEETILYPALQQQSETSEITKEAYEEHQEVKDLLAELEAMSPGEEDWDSLIQELKASVEHHVEEEEGEMFSRAREVLSQQQIEEIGQRIQAAKQQKQATAG